MPAGVSRPGITNLREFEYWVIEFELGTEATITHVLTAEEHGRHEHILNESKDEAEGSERSKELSMENARIFSDALARPEAEPCGSCTTLCAVCNPKKIGPLRAVSPKGRRANSVQGIPASPTKRRWWRN